MSLFILPEEKTPTKFFSMSSLFNPNKAGIFEGSFSWEAQLDPFPLPPHPPTPPYPPHLPFLHISWKTYLISI